MSWPDPDRPGLPADAARPWHWVTRAEDAARANPMPLGWNAGLGVWVQWDGTTLGPEEAARRYAYLGPAQTPAEAEAEKAAAVSAVVPPPPKEPEPLRGLAALAASAPPDPPPAMVFRKDAIRIHLLIFAGTLVATVYLLDMFGRIQ